MRRYGRTDAVNGLTLRVAPGRCYGFFGRNGAGKTTTIKCLLNLLRPTGAVGTAVRPRSGATHEVAVKSRLAYVPDAVAFYPWMSVRQTLDYFASFRRHWNDRIEQSLLEQFQLDPRQKASHLSKGQRTQLALITAICPEPELLILDEPTSGLDPIVRREFIQTVIGAYQDGDPGRRTVFVSTHLISEFEGLIDEFTIIDRGREVLTLEADAARDRYKKIYARFPSALGALDIAASQVLRKTGREVEIIVNGDSDRRHGTSAGARPRSGHGGVADARRDFRLDGEAAGERRMTASRSVRGRKCGRSRRLVGRVLPGHRCESVWHAFRLDPIGVMAYMFGTAALGAHAFGHEYRRPDARRPARAADGTDANPRHQARRRRGHADRADRRRIGGTILADPGSSPRRPRSIRASCSCRR